MEFVMTGNEILEKYRRALTPKARREQIQVLADLNGCDKKDIANFLRACGETVDGRIRNALANKPDAEATEAQTVEQESHAEIEETAAEVHQEEPECCEDAAEPKTEQPPQHERCMKAGTLAGLLMKVDPEAPVLLDGEGYAGWLHVSVVYDTTGAREETGITIHPLDK